MVRTHAITVQTREHWPGPNQTWWDSYPCHARIQTSSSLPHYQARSSIPKRSSWALGTSTQAKSTMRKNWGTRKRTISLGWYPHDYRYRCTSAHAKYWIAHRWPSSSAILNWIRQGFKGKWKDAAYSSKVAAQGSDGRFLRWRSR